MSLLHLVFYPFWNQLTRDFQSNAKVHFNYEFQLCFEWIHILCQLKKYLLHCSQTYFFTCQNFVNLFPQISHFNYDDTIPYLIQNISEFKIKSRNLLIKWSQLPKLATLTSKGYFFNIFTRKFCSTSVKRALRFQSGRIMVSKLAGNSLTRAKKTCFYDKKNSSKCEDPFCVMAFTFLPPLNKKTNTWAWMSIKL